MNALRLPDNPNAVARSVVNIFHAARYAARISQPTKDLQNTDDEHSADDDNDETQGNIPPADDNTDDNSTGDDTSTKTIDDENGTVPHDASNVKPTAFGFDLFENVDTTQTADLNMKNDMDSASEMQNNLMAVMYIASAHFIPLLFSNVLTPDRATLVVRRMVHKWTEYIMAPTRTPVQMYQIDDDSGIEAGIVEVRRDNLIRERSRVILRHVHMRVDGEWQHMQERSQQECTHKNSSSECVRAKVESSVKELIYELMLNRDVSSGLQTTLCPAAWFQSIQDFVHHLNFGVSDSQ